MIDTPFQKPVPIPFNNVCAKLQVDRMKNVKRLVFETLINGPWEEIFEKVKPCYALFSFKNVYAEFQADRMKNVKRLIFETLINGPWDKIFENAETGTQKFSTLFISIYFPSQYSSRLRF